MGLKTGAFRLKLVLISAFDYKAGTSGFFKKVGTNEAASRFRGFSLTDFVWFFCLFLFSLISIIY